MGEMLKMDNPSNILLIISDPVQNNYLKTLIQNFGFVVHTAQRYDEGVKIINDGVPELIVLDSGLRGMHWNDAALKIKESNRDIPILLLASIGKNESSNPNIDGLIKIPLNYMELRDKITRYLKKGNAYYGSEVTPVLNTDEHDTHYIDNLILGQSRRIREVRNIIRRVAEPDVTVLLRGESGTGKELAAQALHHCSKRRNRPFVKVLCAAIPDGLLESELFGHEKGAFTGAHRSKPGKFEFANGGTIFLDEIGDVPQSLQAKLLQVLQDGEFARIGGKDVRVDVRVIAATNKNLERGVGRGNFREDLFYRLNVVSITMPSLRERKVDIPVLIEFFLHKYCQLYNKEYYPISKETLDKFMSYNWPGNVRELENVVKRIIVLSSEKIELSGHTIETNKEETTHSDKKIDAIDTPNKTLKPCNLREIAQEAVRKAEVETIKDALITCKWNKRKAADLLSISYKTLFYKMRQYNLLE